MSIALATKGVIAQFAPAGGGYPIYVPMEEPTVGTEEIGSRSIYGTSLDVEIRGKVLEPDIKAIELKPKMKVD
jgi:hypothetical protein